MSAERYGVPVFNATLFERGKQEVDSLLHQNEFVVEFCEAKFFIPQQSEFGYLAVTNKRLLFSSKPNRGGKQSNRKLSDFAAEIPLTAISDSTWTDLDSTESMMASLLFRVNETRYKILFCGPGPRFQWSEDFKIAFFKTLENPVAAKLPLGTDSLSLQRNDQEQMGSGLTVTSQKTPDKEMSGAQSFFWFLVLILLLGGCSYGLYSLWNVANDSGEDCGELFSNPSPGCQAVYRSFLEKVEKGELP